MLPGRQYTPDGPLLFFAAQTGLVRGWDVRRVWWNDDAPQRLSRDVAEELTWVEGQLRSAVAGLRGRVVIIAKSLGTLAAACAARRRYPAAWLTPLLTEAVVAKPLSSYPVDQLVVIGDSDPCLDQEVFAALPGRRLRVAGDHVLAIADDPVAMVASHDAFVRAFDSWLTSLA